MKTRNIKAGDKVRLCYTGVPFDWEWKDWTKADQLTLGGVYDVNKAVYSDDGKEADFLVLHQGRFCLSHSPYHFELIQ